MRPNLRSLFSILAISSSLAAAQSTNQPAIVHVDTTPGHVLNSFDPDRSLGSSVDVLSHNGIDQVYTPHILEESLSAGWGPITYRNNTELRMAAWHWTENGTWSDPTHKSGYFTSSTDLKEPTRYILAYALPHRGFSTSGDRPIQGPNLTYWKSNPYLTSKFTHENDALHPQWVVVDLRTPQAVSAVEIVWADPYAVTFQIEYWEGKDDALDFDRGPTGSWRLFPNGTFQKSKGGASTLKIFNASITTRYLRVLMTESSNTCDEHGSEDIRNCVGYAIQEIHAGSIDASGTFTDVAKDATGKNQPTFDSSSIDPGTPRPTSTPPAATSTPDSISFSPAASPTIFQH